MMLYALKYFQKDNKLLSLNWEYYNYTDYVNNVICQRDKLKRNVFTGRFENRQNASINTGATKQKKWSHFTSKTWVFTFKKSFNMMCISIR